MMHTKKSRLGLIGVVTVLVAIAALTNLSTSDLFAAYPGEQTLVTFYAMGDVPYAPEEDVLLPQQIADLPKDAEFVAHVGDIKAGSPPCDEAVYNKVFGMLAQVSVPVFIIPGDNEWNDCSNPAQAWEFWKKYFMRFDRRWPHRLPIFRQLEQEENFSFVKSGVLFLGLNIVGGRVHDPEEWTLRHAQILDWTLRNLRQFGDTVSSVVIFGHANPNPAKHNDFFEPFVIEAQAFGKPILYLHGDGHTWIHDRPFAAENILRVQVDKGGIAPPVKITVTDHPTEPFHFDIRMMFAHWKLDETEGIIAHDSAGDNDAFLMGDPAWQPDGGIVDGALQFDGIDDYVSTDFVLNPADGAFSVVAWIKGGAPGQVIMSQTQDGANWLLADPSEGKLRTSLSRPAGSRFIPPPLLSEFIITDGAWHRVGLTWDGSSRILYVDDIEVARDTQAGLGSSGGGLYIGAGNNLEAGSFWSGLIDDVRIYNRAVSP